MRKTITIFVGVLCIVCAGLAGCGAQKVSSSSEAIQSSKAMKTAQEQADYLVSQANAFYNSKEFKEAIVIADYVLNNVDKDSQQAKALIAKAKKELAALAQKKIEEAKGKMGLQ